MRILFAIISVIVAALGVALPFFMESPLLYYFEGAVAVVLICLLLLYLSVVGPMGALDRGIDLLKAQDFSSRLVHVGYGPADRIADTFNSMIARLRAERLRVREQNHFLDLLAEASPMGIIVMNFDGTVQSANPAAERMLGVKGLKDCRLEDVHDELADALVALKPGRAETVRLADTRMFRCSRLSLLDSGHQRPFLLMESLTEELLEAEREAYGKVIRTMVHEVNNTLAGIIPLVETAALISADESMEAAAHSCTERCTALSTFIGNFAHVVKLGAPQLKRVDVNAFLLNMRPFLESLTSVRGIRLEYSLGENMRAVELDTVQFEQVLVNVVKHAVDSIGHDGVVEISTTAQPPTLIVTDNGAGITPEAIGKLFSPFFSTKKSGQGIGLTLSAEILRAHHFEFSLATSAADSLTRFTIRF